MGQMAFSHTCHGVHTAAGSVSRLHAAVQKLSWMCQLPFRRCLIFSIESMTSREWLHPLFCFCGSVEILNYVNDLEDTICLEQIRGQFVISYMLGHDATSSFWQSMPGTLELISCWPSSWKLFETSLPFDRQQSAEGPVVLNLFPSQCLWKSLLGIISKGVWSQSAPALQWFKGGDVRTILVSPLWGRGHLREVPSNGKKCTQVLHCFEALA